MKKDYFENIWLWIENTYALHSGSSVIYHELPLTVFPSFDFAGKRWVECRDKGQISIPEKVDIETQVLDLSGNNLQILPREVFSRRGLLNLQKLFLSDCKLGQIDPTAFRGLTNLVELNLSGNLLTSVPTATFSGKKETQGGDTRHSQSTNLLLTCHSFQFS